MTIQIGVGEAKTRLSELLAKVEAGEDVVIARGGDPIVRLVRIHKRDQVERAIAAILASQVGRAPTTTEEIIAWRDEGKRF